MRLTKSALCAFITFSSLVSSNAFQNNHYHVKHPSVIADSLTTHQMRNDNDNDHITKNSIRSRRRFLEKSISAISSSSILLTTAGPSFQSANAIDVSGLPVEGRGGGTPAGGSSLSQQLKSYDSSSMTITPSTNPTAPSSSSSSSTAATTLPGSPSSTMESKIDKSIAVSARRSMTNPPILKKSAFGTMARFEENILGPPGSPKQYVYVTFEFPSDWLQLDRMLGGIQFVDQRNGDKVYLLQAKLPDGTDLSTAPKQFFADSIFDPKGSISSGLNIDDYKVSSSSISSQIVNCPQSGACSSTRRRMKVKYATVTGNGLRVERRALVDAYELDGWAYMLMATQNAVKFEAKGKERETVDNIVDSFRLEV